jgi:hypothetical protein
MLKNINWTDFLIIVFFLTASYYLVIGLLFYRNSIRGMFRKGWRSKRIGIPGEAVPDRAIRDEDPASKQTDDFVATKEACDKLKLVVNRAISDGVTTVDLLTAIKVHLRPYKRFQGTAFGIAIKNSITRELSQAGLTLSEDDLDGLWFSS